MSRISEALKRARASNPDAPAPVSGPSAAPPIPPAADAFVAPWDFQPSEREAPAGPAGEAAIPPRADTAASSGSSVKGALAPDAAQHTHRPRLSPRFTGHMAVFQGFSPSLVEKIVVSAPSASVEQYRRLAGTLHHAQMERNLKVVMMTSAGPGEGKSLTATNLALTLSESYHRKVLLIDADLRRPTLQEVFRVPNVSGLSDGLKAAEGEKLSIIRISLHLSLLTAGPPISDPMSSLTSDRMRRVIEEAAGYFDWVVIDSPPVGVLPDANLLAAMVDAVLLVIEAGKTPYPLVQRAIDAVGRDKVVGVVLNRVQDEFTFGGYHYHRYSASYSKKTG